MKRLKLQGVKEVSKINRLRYSGRLGATKFCNMTSSEVFGNVVE